jgi:hypothetical protein
VARALNGLKGPLGKNYYIVFVWKFLNSGRTNKSGVLTPAVINFGSLTEKRTRLAKSLKKPGEKFVILPANENYARIAMT